MVACTTRKRARSDRCWAERCTRREKIVRKIGRNLLAEQRAEQFPCPLPFHMGKSQNKSRPGCLASPLPYLTLDCTCTCQGGLRRDRPAPPSTPRLSAASSPWIDVASLGAEKSQTPGPPRLTTLVSHCMLRGLVHHMVENPAKRIRMSGPLIGTHR